MNKKCGFIFDMDGVIIDNADFHYQAWEEFCKRENYPYERGESKYWFGNTNKEILAKIYQRELTEDELITLADRKESIYREMIASHLEPVRGLVELLKEMKLEGYPVAMATSAPPENVDFVTGKLDIRKYFDHIVDASGVKNGKPSPEIYLKAAKLLDLPPSKCLVFEDAIAGIASANRAGMKVIGLITTLEEEDIKDTERNIHDFTEITLGELKKLVCEESQGK